MFYSVNSLINIKNYLLEMDPMTTQYTIGQVRNILVSTFQMPMPTYDYNMVAVTRTNIPQYTPVQPATEFVPTAGSKMAKYKTSL